MNDTFHHNQGIESILDICLYMIIAFIFSTFLTFLFLKCKKRRLQKSILINLFFYLSIFILFQISIYENINIAVFSRNNKEELVLLLTFCLTYLFLTSLQFVIFRKWTNREVKYKLIISNLSFLIFILYNFYPRPYVDKNIINYDRILFKPIKRTLKLVDNSIVELEVACLSIDNYTNKQKNHSFNFRIPIKINKSDRMSFGFELLDKTNQFGTSESGSNCKVISLRKVKNEIIVLFLQKNPDKNIGWIKPIITDTIVFKKTVTEKRKAGYYGDTNCDCIEH